MTRGAIFFDAAGTLFDAREPVGHTYARIARKHGVNADDESATAGFRRAFGSSDGLAFGPGRDGPELMRLERRWWRELVARSFAGLGEFDDFDAFFDELFAYFAEPAHWRAFPDALASLDRLAQDGFRLGVISNFDSRLHRILDGLGLRSCFECVMISTEVGYAKPAREIFVAAMERLGVSADKAAHVGDSEHMDVAGAQAVGMAGILLDPTAPEKPVLNDRGARVRSLASVAEVVPLLRFA